MAYTLVTVVKSYENPDGSIPGSVKWNPAVSSVYVPNVPGGVVTFTLSSVITDSSTGEEVVPRPIEVAVDTTGTVTQQLVANDDSTTVPSGSVYTVEERIAGSPVNRYNIRVPFSSAPGPVELTTLVVVGP